MSRGLEHRLGTLAAIRSLVGEAASATRGFAITGQDEHLLPYAGARANIEARMADLRALTADNADCSANWARWGP